MKKYKLFSIILILCLTFLPISGFVFAGNMTDSQTDNTNIITEPYEYPVTPDSPQWKSFTQTSQMIDACQVQENIVCKMTTEALLDTVMNYPLIVNVLVQNAAEIGYNFLFETNAAFRELVKRNDMIDVIDEKLFSKKAQNHSKKTDEQIVAETGIKMIYDILAAKNSVYIAKSS